MTTQPRATRVFCAVEVDISQRPGSSFVGSLTDISETGIGIRYVGRDHLAALQKGDALSIKGSTSSGPFVVNGTVERIDLDEDELGISIHGGQVDALEWLLESPLGGAGPNKHISR